MSKQFLPAYGDLSGIRTRQLILPAATLAASGLPGPSGTRTRPDRNPAEYPGRPRRHNHVDDSERSRRDRDLILGLLIAAVLAAMVALAL
jgi:hypothetical protein